MTPNTDNPVTIVNSNSAHLMAGGQILLQVPGNYFGTPLRGTVGDLDRSFMPARGKHL